MSQNKQLTIHLLTLSIRGIILISLMTCSPLIIRIEAQKAIRFSHQGDYLEIPNQPSLQSNEMTIEFWLYVESPGDTPDGEQTLFDKREDNKGVNIRMAGSDFPLPVFCFYLPANEVHAFPGVDRKRWTHYAYVFAKDSSKVYENGALIANVPSGEYDAKSTPPLRIGEFLGYPGASFRLQGQLDEIRIWSKVLTPAEIRSRMHSTLSGNESNLELYLDFELSSSSLVIDKSRNQNNARRYGNTTLLTSTAPIGFIPLAAPSGFRSYGLEHSIRLEWKPVANANSYLIYRSTNADLDAEPSTRITEVDAGTQTWEDMDIDENTLYYYLVTATDQEGHAGLPSGLTVTRTIDRVDYQTGVYYYPWYQPELDHHLWPGAYARYFMEPPQPPFLGHYSSASTSVINQHFDWMEQAGIDFIVSSWWGPDSREDVVLKENIVPPIRQRNLKFAVYYESAILGLKNGRIEFNEVNSPYFKEHFSYLADTYFHEPNYLTIEGKPVVFLYLEHIYAGNYQQTITEVRQELSAQGIELFLIGDMNLYGVADVDHLKPMDGASPYIPLQGVPAGKYPDDVDFLNRLAKANASRQEELMALNKLYIPDVYPGFNNRELEGGFVFPRQLAKEELPTSVFKNAIKVSRPYIDSEHNMIMITSWNEWHEDTEIEPTIETITTNTDNSNSGMAYTGGYNYQGFGGIFLDLTRALLGDGLSSSRQPGLPAIPTFTVYPNPATNTIHLYFSSRLEGTFDLQLHALDGRLLWEQPTEVPTSRSVTLPLHHLHSGLYLLSLSNDDGIRTVKVVIN
ncbi:MAG: glycoside hydrolase family 99-like domain-containing protein [Saprospiraceae bacterium]|nr:glycoside hydrolase family 99-like domain-containing protein [Saprospiraceae bacterium]